MQLIFNRPGLALNRESGAFVVRDRQQMRRTISPEAVSSILILEPAMLSSAAVALAAQHDIPVVILDRQGQPVGRLWQAEPGSTARIRRHQARWGDRPAAARWAARNLEARLRGAARWLRLLAGKHPLDASYFLATARVLAATADQFAAAGPSLDGWDTTIKARWRGWEGAAMATYWGCLGQTLPEGLRFQQRSRRPALDPANAVLNYLYGILYARVETALLQAGLDSHLGVFHADGHNRATLVYDWIERFRVWAEQCLWALAWTGALKPDLMEGAPGGGIRLQASLRGVLVQTLNERLEQPLLYKGRRIAAGDYLVEAAYALAAALKEETFTALWALPLLPPGLIGAEITGDPSG